MCYLQCVIIIGIIVKTIYIWIYKKEMDSETFPLFCKSFFLRKLITHFLVLKLIYFILLTVKKVFMLIPFYTTNRPVIGYRCIL